MLRTKNESLQKDLAEMQSQKIRQQVLIDVCSNNIEGHGIAIGELDNRVAWHHNINRSLVKVISEAVQQHVKMHVSTDNNEIVDLKSSK